MIRFALLGKACLALAAPLTVAAVVVAGLVLLSVENLNGSVVARQLTHDRAAAIRNLFFRD